MFWYVSPVTLPRSTCHQLAGDANTQNCESVQSNSPPSQGRRRGYVDLRERFEFHCKVRMWKYCAIVLLRHLICRWYQMWTNCTTLQCEGTVVATLCCSSYNKCPDFNTTAGTIISAPSITTEFKCDNTVCYHAAVMFWFLCEGHGVQRAEQP
jgi:hypothetical protein